MEKLLKAHIKIIFIATLLVSCASLSFANDLLEDWSGDVFAGYNQTNGNTEKASGSFSARTWICLNLSRTPQSPAVFSRYSWSSSPICLTRMLRASSISTSRAHMSLLTTVSSADAIDTLVPWKSALTRFFKVRRPISS